MIEHEYTPTYLFKTTAHAKIMYRKKIWAVVIIFIVSNILIVPISGNNNDSFVDEINIRKGADSVFLLDNFHGLELFPNEKIILNNVGDFNDNSRIDFLGYNNTNSIKIEWNSITRSFEKVAILGSEDVQIMNSYVFEDLNGDNTIDISCAQNFSLYNWRNNTFEFISEVNGPEHAPKDYADFDSDGDLDIITNGGRSGFYIYRNQGNGSFNITNMDGLPHYGEAGDLTYKSLCEYFQDINNDGWIDICTGTANQLKRAPGPFLFWINDGGEVWSNFSSGSPTFDMGYEMKMADLDNDNDSDCIMTFSDNGTLILENNYPHPWKAINLPNDDNQMKDFQDSEIATGDIDNDGNIDIVQTLYQKIYNNNDELDYVKSIVVIYWNLGDFAFRLEISGEFLMSGPGLFPLVDIDLDGMLDIVVSPMSSKNEGMNPIVFFNDREHPDEFFIRPLRKGDIYRAGTYDKIEWSSNRMKELLNDENFFNLSISYFGKDEIYFPLLTNISKWWTYWTVPEYPTNNAYIKIEGLSFEATYGPIKIFSKEDRKYPITCNFDTNHIYFTSGRDIGLFIDGSQIIEENTTAKIEIFHEKGNIYLGDFPIEPGQFKRVTCTIPEYLHYIDSKIQVTIELNGRDVTWIQDETYNILTPYTYLETIQITGNNNVGRGDVEQIDIKFLSTFGQYLNHHTDINLIYDEEVISISEPSDWTYNVTGLELGITSLKVIGNCWGVERTVFFDLEVVRSLGNITLETNDGQFHTGDSINIHLNATDLLGETIDLQMNEVTWTVEGERRILSSNETDINFIPSSPGFVEIEATVVIEWGNATAVDNITISSAISSLRILPLDDPIFTGNELVIFAEIMNWKNESMEDVLTYWSSAGPVTVVNRTTFTITLIPDTEGEINISIQATFNNEIFEKSITFEALSDIDRIVLGSESINVPLGSTISTDIELLNTLNATYTGQYNYSLRRWIDLYFTPSISNGKLVIEGNNIGSSELTIVAITPYSEVEMTIMINVFEPITEIKWIQPVKIVRNIPSVIELSFFGQKGSIIDPTDLIITTSSGSIFDTNETSKILVQVVGFVDITVNACYFGYSLEINFSVEVVPKSDSISISNLPKYIRIGTSYTLHGDLLLENGKHTKDFSWFSIVNDGYSIIGNGSNFEIIFTQTGIFNVSLSAEYFDQFLETTIETEVFEKPVLTSLELITIVTSNGRIFEVVAYDQYGINITDICQIEWDGSFSQLDDNKVLSHKKSISVVVTHDGKSLTEKRTNEKESNLITGVIIVVCTVLILIAILILVVFIRNRDPQNNNLEGETYHYTPNSDVVEYNENQVMDHNFDIDPLIPTLESEE